MSFFVNGGFEFSNCGHSANPSLLETAADNDEGDAIALLSGTTLAQSLTRLLTVPNHAKVAKQCGKELVIKNCEATVETNDSCLARGTNRVVLVIL